MQLQRYKMAGILPDPPPAEVPPEHWTTCTNMLNRVGFMRRSKGNPVAGTYSSLDPIHVFFWFRNLGLNYYFLLCDANIKYIIGGGAVNNLTGPFTAGVFTQDDVSGGIINNAAVFNYQNQVPYYWQILVGPTTHVAWPIGQWPANQRAEVVRTWRNHVFAAAIWQGTNYNPDLLMWSSSATALGGIPTEWVPTATNDARAIFLGEVPGAIIDMVPLRDMLMVFKNQAMYSLQFIGGAFVFNSRKITDSMGIMGKNCAVDIGGSLVVLGNDDVMLTDGQSFKSIATQRIRNTLAAQTDRASKRLCFVFYNQGTRDVYICIARTGHSVADLAWIWNANTDEWSFIDLIENPGAIATGLTCASFVPPPTTAAQSYTVPEMTGVEIQFGTGTCRFVIVQGADTWSSGGAVVGRLKRYGLDGGAPDIVKYLNRVDLNLTNPNPGTAITISVSGRMRESDAVAAPVFQTVTNTDSYQFPCNVVGRFIDIEIQSAAIDWECHGLSLVFGDPSGY